MTSTKDERPVTSYAKKFVESAEKNAKVYGNIAIGQQEMIASGEYFPLVDNTQKTNEIINKLQTELEKEQTDNEAIKQLKKNLKSVREKDMKSQGAYEQALYTWVIDQEAKAMLIIYMSKNQTTKVDVVKKVDRLFEMFVGLHFENDCKYETTYNEMKEEMQKTLEEIRKELNDKLFKIHGVKKEDFLIENDFLDDFMHIQREFLETEKLAAGLTDPQQRKIKLKATQRDKNTKFRERLSSHEDPAPDEDKKTAQVIALMKESTILMISQYKDEKKDTKDTKHTKDTINLLKDKLETNLELLNEMKSELPNEKQNLVTGEIESTNAKIEKINEVLEKNDVEIEKFDPLEIYNENDNPDVEKPKISEIARKKIEVVNAWHTKTQSEPSNAQKELHEQKLMANEDSRRAENRIDQLETPEISPDKALDNAVDNQADHAENPNANGHHN